jgi:cholesterol transport system auxiliary component
MIRVALGAVILGLAGCVTSRPPPKQFDLGEFNATGNGSSIVATNLTVADVSQPSWMRTRDMFYRLDYELPPRPQRYAFNQWVASPGELVGLRLRQIVQSGNAGLTQSTPIASGAYQLQSSLEEFTQTFTTASDSQCIVQLRASLWRTDGRIAGQRAFRVENPAPTPDAGGAALCLAAAVNRVGDEIVQWLSGLTVRAP